MMKRLFCILLSVMLLAAAPFALAEDTPAEEAPAEEAAAAETAAEEAAPVLLATISGEEIWSDNEKLAYVYDYYTHTAQSYGYDMETPEVLALVRQSAMYQMIKSKLIADKAAELGLDTVTDEEKESYKTAAKEEWDNAVDYYAEQMGNLTETSTDEEKEAARADAVAYIKENFNVDEDLYVTEVINSQTEDVLTRRVEEYVLAGETVTDEEVQQYFDDLVKEDQEQYMNDVATYEFYTQYYGQSSYYTPEGYRGIIHILLPVDEELLNKWKDLSARLEEQESKTEEEPTVTAEAPAEGGEPTAEPEPTPEPEPVTQEMVDAAEQEILDSVQGTVDEIMGKLESGTSFVDLIKEYGTDSGMKDEARLASGYPVHNDSILYDPAFQKAAMELEKIGDVSKPVVGQYGVHILQYLRDVPGGATELTDEMKEEFRATLQEELINSKMSSAIIEWALAADIEYTEDGEPWKIDFAAEAESAAEEAAAEEEAVPAE